MLCVHVFRVCVVICILCLCVRDIGDRSLCVFSWCVLVWAYVVLVYVYCVCGCLWLCFIYICICVGFIYAIGICIWCCFFVMFFVMVLDSVVAIMCVIVRLFFCYASHHDLCFPECVVSCAWIWGVCLMMALCCDHCVC